MLSAEEQQKIKAVRQQFYLFPDSDNDVVLQKISYRGGNRTYTLEELRVENHK